MFSPRRWLAPCTIEQKKPPYAGSKRSKSGACPSGTSVSPQCYGDMWLGHQPGGLWTVLEAKSTQTPGTWPLKRVGPGAPAEVPSGFWGSGDKCRRSPFETPGPCSTCCGGPGPWGPVATGEATLEPVCQLPSAPGALPAHPWGRVSMWTGRGPSRRSPPIPGSERGGSRMGAPSGVRTRYTCMHLVNKVNWAVFGQRDD